MKETKYVKVIDSTHNPYNKKIEMIGGVYEVLEINYGDSTINIYNKNKTNYWMFNFSDVIEVTKEEYEKSKVDTLVGTEVEVKIGGKTYKAIIK